MKESGGEYASLPLPAHLDLSWLLTTSGSKSVLLRLLLSCSAKETTSLLLAGLLLLLLIVILLAKGEPPGRSRAAKHGEKESGDALSRSLAKRVCGGQR